MKDQDCILSIYWEKDDSLSAKSIYKPFIRVREVSPLSNEWFICSEYSNTLNLQPFSCK